MRTAPTATNARDLLALVGIKIEATERDLLLHVNALTRARFCSGGLGPSSLVLGRDGRIVVGAQSSSPEGGPFRLWVASDNGIWIVDGDFVAHQEADPKTPEPLPDLAAPSFTFPDGTSPAEALDAFAAALHDALVHTGDLHAGQIQEDDEILELVDGASHRAVIYRLGTETAQPEAGYVFPWATDSRPDLQTELTAWARGESYAVSLRDAHGREVDFWWAAHARDHIRAIAHAMIADAERTS